MPDETPCPPPDQGASAPITVYLSDVLDLEKIDGDGLDGLDLALKSDGPFTVEPLDDGRVCLHLPFGEDHLSFAMVLSNDAARELADGLRKRFE